MNTYPIPANEEERLKELYALGILDTEDEQDFTDIVELASYICNAPISLISLIDRNRQWFKARVGITDREMSRQIAFCAHTIAGNGPFVVPDATHDSRFANYSNVTGDPHIRFYAGIPLVTPSGHSLGSLCVIDDKPGVLQPGQEKALSTLAKQVVKLMEERARTLRYKETARLEKIQNTALERMMQTQRRILTILGHDARAPLYAINQLLKITARTNASETNLKSNIDLITNQLSATLIMIEDLLSWGKNHLRPHIDMKGQEFEIRALADEVLEVLKGNAGLKNTSLANLVEPGLQSPIPGTMMSFIIRNLVNNAIKFTSSGAVTVSSLNTENGLQVVVQDTGKGMTAAQLEHLNRGVSQPGSESNMLDSGIGIIMIQEFLLQLGGRIEFESTEGQGTKVTVTLPAVKTGITLDPATPLLN